MEDRGIWGQRRAPFRKSDTVGQFPRDGVDFRDSGGTDLYARAHDRLHAAWLGVAKIQAENPGAPVPVDLVTSSGSGLDPEISPAAAEFQILRIAHSRNMEQEDLRALLQKHTQGRDFGFVEEPRVNVLELNLELDAVHPAR
jgi:potassium-transporting ATPase KdpC subunit